MDKQTPVSQSQEVREMFHARFDGCLVLYLIRILTLTLMSNFDINVCLCLGFTAQSTQWGHVERGQFS